MKLTASGKETALVAFYRQLRREGLTVTQLAACARVGRAHLAQILTGRRAGRATWKHLVGVLSDPALFHLQQCSAWNTHAAAALVEHQAIVRAYATARARGRAA